MQPLHAVCIVIECFTQADTFSSLTDMVDALSKKVCIVLFIAIVFLLIRLSSHLKYAVNGIYSGTHAVYMLYA